MYKKDWGYPQQTVSLNLIKKTIASIEINIIVRYGVNIREVGKNIQEKVKEEVENMTGNKVDRVVVNVQGVKVDDDTEEKIDNMEE